MLETELNVVHAHGDPLPVPDITTLRDGYHLGATLRALPQLGWRSDIYRVLQLRPTVRSSIARADGCTSVHKGYFAYGRVQENNVLFSIYTPHPNSYGHPPKELKKAMAFFAVCLLDQGYGLPPNAITYVPFNQD